jgi:hypothetical protein
MQLSLRGFSISLLLCSFRTQELMVSIAVHPEIAEKRKKKEEERRKKEDIP